MSRGGRQTAGAFVVLGLLVAGATLVALGAGRSGVGLGDALAALAGDAPDEATAGIVRVVRLPRAVLALLVGAALSIAGVLFQALLQNDLAEPYLLGVGPGALFGVTIAALVAGAAGPGTMPEAAVRGGFAFAGSLGVTMLVFAFVRRSGPVMATTVLLAGVAVGAFVSAIATGILHARVRDWHQVSRWLLGDLTLASLGDAALLAGAVLAAGGFAFVRARDLDVLTLGEEGAWLSGVTLRSLLVGAGAAAALLAAAAVALAGLVGFVGLVVPHLARRLLGASHRTLIPAAALLGAALLALADALARTLNPPSGFPLGVVTAVLGAPVLAALLLRRVR